VLINGFRILDFLGGLWILGFEKGEERFWLLV
jgi:hypothetical protein